MPPRPPDPIDDLYQQPLDGFVAARNALAARLKREGKSAESAAVKALTRPTASAWAVNQVYWRERDLHDRLIAAGDRLRAIQQQALAGRSADPRDATRARQEAIRALVDRAAQFLQEAGNPVTDATRQRVGVTADALATWGSQPQGYTFGRLTRDLDPPGFAALAALGAPALRLVKPARDADASRAAPGPAPKPSPATAPRGIRGKPTGGSRRAAGEAQPDPRAEQRARREQEAQRRAQRADAREALQRAQKEAGRLASAEARARDAVARAREQMAALQHERDALRARLDAIEERLQRADGSRREAEAALHDAEAARAEAERAVGDAEQAFRAIMTGD
jgi:hypothetical protein